jgi:hypothetical protein
MTVGKQRSWAADGADLLVFILHTYTRKQQDPETLALLAKLKSARTFAPE